MKESTSLDDTNTELMKSMLKSEQNTSYPQMEELRKPNDSSIDMSYTLDKQLRKLTTVHRRAVLKQKSKRSKILGLN